jgi:glycosyltransferase involved in cell wall biosynthesis
MNSVFDVVILIPHYNNPKGLISSLQSIENFDDKVVVLIVDDGSKAEKLNVEYIKSSCNLPTEFLFLEENLGIEHALNYGLNYIASNYPDITYIARIDCDDICLGNRIKVQYEYLQENKEISFIGSNVRFVDTNKKKLYDLNLPLNHDDITKKMYFNAMFIHPSIFFRKEILSSTGLYPTDKKAAEDYAFFFNVLKKCKVANIPEILVECVIDPDGISGKKRKQQVISRISVIKDNFYFGFYPIVGILRNVILLIIPRNLSNGLKSFLKK